MSLRSELSAILKGMPPGSAVSLPVEWLRSLLAEDARQGGRPDRLLTLEEVAELAGRSKSTVRTWANSGMIEGAFRLHGREWRIPSRAWERHLESLQKGEEGPEVAEVGSVDLGSWRRVREQRR